MYKSCQRLLSSVGSKMQIEPQAMEDIFQETLCLLIEKVRQGAFTFKSRASFYGWFKATIENMAKTYRHNTLRFVQNDIQSLPLAQSLVQNEPILAPTCSLQQKTLEMIESKLSPQAAKVLAVGVVYDLPNEFAAKIMNYKDESVFRKKKSLHLAELRGKISKSEKAYLGSL